jgi:hypothetical protein
MAAKPADKPRPGSAAAEQALLASIDTTLAKYGTPTSPKR